MTEDLRYSIVCGNLNHWLKPLDHLGPPEMVEHIIVRNGHEAQAAGWMLVIDDLRFHWMGEAVWLCPECAKAYDPKKRISARGDRWERFLEPDTKPKGCSHKLQSRKESQTMNPSGSQAGLGKVGGDHERSVSETQLICGVGYRGVQGHGDEAARRDCCGSAPRGARWGIGAGWGCRD